MGPVDRDREGTPTVPSHFPKDGLGKIPTLILPRQRASSLPSSWSPPAAPAVGQTPCAATSVERSRPSERVGAGSGKRYRSAADTGTEGVIPNARPFRPPLTSE